MGHSVGYGPDSDLPNLENEIFSCPDLTCPYDQKDQIHHRYDSYPITRHSDRSCLMNKLITRRLLCNKSFSEIDVDRVEIAHQHIVGHVCIYPV